MVRYATPGRFKQRLEEEKRRKEEERRLEEQRKREELARRQYIPSTPAYQPTIYGETSRRSWLKGAAALAITGAVAAIIGGIANYRPTETPSPPVQQTEQQQTPQVQQTPSSMDNPDNWPVKRTLPELAETQKQTGSRLQFCLPEYDSYPAERLYNLGIEPLYLTQDQVVRLYPDSIGVEDLNKIMGGKPRLVLFSVGKSPLSVAYYDHGSGYYGNLGNMYTPYDKILQALDPDDGTDEVLFRNNSGLYMRIKG